MIPVWLGLLLSLLWFVSLGTLSLSAMALYLRAHSARMAREATLQGVAPTGKDTG